MGTLKLVLTIVQVLAALFLTFVVLAQSGKSAGLSGAIAGGADTFLSKNKAKSWDAKLARWTRGNRGILCRKAPVPWPDRDRIQTKEIIA